MKIIPLHCLIFILGDDPSSRFRVAREFSESVMSTNAILEDIAGTDRRSANHIVSAEIDMVAQEMLRRMLSRLKLGKRAIVMAHDLSRAQRVSLATAARAQGVPIFYLITSNVPDEARHGDGLAEVVDATEESLVLVPHQPDLSRFNGVTVVGDVHGMHQTFLNVLDWARDRNHFVALLGDVLSYGPGTLEMADEAYRLVMRGAGAFVLGNHERKIMKWLNGEEVKLSEGNKVTTSALSHLGETGMSRWAGRFRGLYQNSHLIYSINNVILAHGAVHPNFWSEKDETSKVVENHAFFGETDMKPSSERPMRTYRWVESIPSDRIVVVGHDRRATKPVIQTNPEGGTAVFLDTGSGKGGVLSSADFRFQDGKLAMSNLNIF